MTDASGAGPASPNAQPPPSTEGSKVPSDRFRVAQVDQGAAGPQPLGTNDNQNSENKKKEEALTEIVVTGSHIHGEQPSSSMIVVDRTDIDQSGYQDVGQLVRNLPQSFGGGQNIGTLNASGSQNTPNPSDPSTVNLRGLGSESTLTLVNGHRLAYDGATGSVDISVIPLAAIERVEILTDGASAIYGSDAVAGVANFVLRKDFSGVYTSATLGQATEGGGFQQQYTALGGTQWDGGNALISYEFARQDRIDASQRSFVDPILAGTSLWPATERNSMFAALSQDFGTSATGFLQALYTHRNTADPQNQAVYQPGLFANSTTTVDQYGIATGVDISLPDDWRLTIDGDFSRDTDNNLGTATLDDQLLESQQLRYDNQLWTSEVSIDGPLYALPAGIVKLAAGGGVRGEHFESNTVPASPLQEAGGARNVRDLYAELSVPLLPPLTPGGKPLVLDLAGRYENYSDFGGAFNWKGGLSYQPISDINIHASHGTAFRAPSLFQQHSLTGIILEGGIADPTTPTGFTNVLQLFGGNPSLRPEKSDTTTAGIDLSPTFIPGFSLALSWFDIRYRDRIEQPVTNTYIALTDPLYTQFVTRNPSGALQSTALSQAGLFINEIGTYDPASVGGLINNVYQNFTTQRADGVDILARYRHPLPIGNLNASLNSTILSLQQQFLPGSPNQTLDGTVFEPSRLRARSALGWDYQRWNVSLVGNYVGKSQDIIASPPVPVASWTTFDAVVGYSIFRAEHRPLVRLEFAAQNLFDRAPPYVEPAASTLPGVHYDSTNANPIGRFVSAQIAVQW